MTSISCAVLTPTPHNLEHHLHGPITQVRKWTPWHRHVTTVMLALAFLAVTQTALPDDNDALVDQGKDRQPPPHPP